MNIVKNIARITTIILVCIVLLSVRVKALEQCTNFDNNYGHIETRVQKVRLTDNYSQGEIVTYRVSPEKTKDGSWNKGIHKLKDNYYKESDKQKKFFAQFNASSEGTNIKTATYTIYSKSGAECSFTYNVEKDYGNTQIFKIMFDVTKGEIERIEFSGTYLHSSDGSHPDGSYEKNYSKKTIYVRKITSDKNKHYKPGKKSETTLKAISKNVKDSVVDDVVVGRNSQYSTAPEVTAQASLASGKSKNVLDCTTKKGVTNADGTPKYDCNTNTDRKCNQELADMARNYWKLVLIFVPIALILLTTVDFVKSIVSSDADAIKKAGTAALKRTIAAVTLLMAPYTLNIILKWFGIPLCL